MRILMTEYAYGAEIRPTAVSLEHVVNAYPDPDALASWTVIWLSGGGGRVAIKTPFTEFVREWQGEKIVDERQATPVTQQPMSQQEARELVSKLWQGVGFSGMLNTLADAVADDNSHIPNSAKYANEKAVRTALTANLRGIAQAMEEDS